MACLLGGYVACPINSEIDNYRYNQILKIIKPSFVIDNIKKVNIIKTNTKLKEMNISESDFLIIFTSGTTGLSKGILFDSKKFLLSAKSFAELTEYNENTIVYHCLPMFYMAGILNTFFSCIFSMVSLSSITCNL